MKFTVEINFSSSHQNIFQHHIEFLVQLLFGQIDVSSDSDSDFRLINSN